MVLTPLSVVVRLAVLAGESEVLVDKELAGDGVAGGEEGEPDDDTCEVTPVSTSSLHLSSTSGGPPAVI